MKHNGNIFIIIGVTLLASGQLQGLALEKSTKLAEQDIQLIPKQIENELAKSPKNYQKVNFWAISDSIRKIKNFIAAAESSAPTLAKRLSTQQRQLSEKLADSILANLTNLAEPIKKTISYISGQITLKHDDLKLIEQFPPRKEGNIIPFIHERINEIISRLDSASQQGLLVSKDIMFGKVEEKTWNSASKAATEIVKLVINLLLSTFPDYISKRNTLSKRGKENKANPILEVDNFFGTTMAIRLMNFVIENLYSKLPGIFRNGSPLVENFNKQIAACKSLLSGLKTDLYNIFQVKKSKQKGKIEILYYFIWDGSEDGQSPTTFEPIYSEPIEDLLANIGYSVDEIEKKRKLIKTLKVIGAVTAVGVTAVSTALLMPSILKQVKKLNFIQDIKAADIKSSLAALKSSLLEKIEELRPKWWGNMEAEKLGSHVQEQLKGLGSRAIGQLKKLGGRISFFFSPPEKLDLSAKVPKIDFKKIAVPVLEGLDLSAKVPEIDFKKIAVPVLKVRQFIFPKVDPSKEYPKAVEWEASEWVEPDWEDSEWVE